MAELMEEKLGMAIKPMQETLDEIKQTVVGSREAYQRTRDGMIMADNVNM